MLKFLYDSKEEIPAGFEQLYSEKNGKWEITGISGIKTVADVERVQTSLTAERNAHKATKDRLRQVSFKGQSIVEMNDDQLRDAVTQLDRFEELEVSAGQINDDKINQIVESRIKTKLAPVERERDTLKTTLAEREEKIQGYETTNRQRAIHDAVRSAATDAKVLPSALDDALMLAERIFDVAEDGSVTVKDQVGFTPGVTPDLWLSEIQPKRGHWWPESVGGGAKGGRGTQGGGNNPWSKESWNLTAQGAYIREHGTEKANQMAGLAGSKVGATAPASK
jgi:hypothetical protein